MALRIGDLAHSQRLIATMAGIRARLVDGQAAASSGKAAASYDRIADRAGELGVGDREHVLLDDLGANHLRLLVPGSPALIPIHPRDEPRIARGPGVILEHLVHEHTPLAHQVEHIVEQRLEGHLLDGSLVLPDRGLGPQDLGVIVRQGLRCEPPW